MAQTELLIREIESLNSVKFEQLCYILCDALAARRLIHKGLTPRGQPRKSTVDSYSSDGSVVGEYSIDKQYFSHLDKPEGDIKHALKLHPTVKHVYLFASVAASPTEGTKMANLCACMKKQHQIEIEWFDSERIAHYILTDLLPKTVLVEELGKYLPYLNEIYCSNSNMVILPELPKNTRFNQSMLESPHQILIKEHILLLWGISGIGKTCLSVKLANVVTMANKLDAVYFINAAQIESVRDLFAVDCEMAGRKINLVSTLQTRNTLFIIDDLRHELDSILAALKEKISASSYVIVTSQMSSQYALKYGMEYQVPYLDDEELADQIINSGLPTPKRCTRQDIKLILKRTNGYPLLLNSIHVALFYDKINQSEIQEFLEDIPSIEVEDEKTLMAKILYRHQDTLERELFSIKWLGTQYISEPLLTRLITKEGINKLLKRSLIQRSVGIIKIHDIIFQCILDISLQRVDDKMRIRCQQLFYKFLMAGREEKSADYFKAIHLHENKIVSLARQCDSPGIEWFFCLHAFSGNHINESAPFFSADDLVGDWLTSSQDEYVIGTALEYIDRRLREINRKDPEYLNFVQTQIETLQAVQTKLEPASKVYANVVRHLGKLYSAIRNPAEAAHCFEEVLTHHPQFYEARLQMARIHKKNGDDGSIEQAVQEYCEILDTYIRGDTISMSVVLAAYEDFCSIKGYASLKKYYFIDQFSYFEKAISSMAVDFFDQPYKVLAKTMKFYSHPYPEESIRLINCIPLPSVETINRNSFFDVAQMYKEAGKALIWAENPNLKQAESYFLMAENFYIHLKERQLDEEYVSTQRAENLILLNRFSEAAILLEKHSVPGSPFWNYRIGQALAHGSEENLRRSIKHFQTAIDMEIQKGESKYLSAFYHELAKSLNRLHDPLFEDAYSKALAYCTNDKHRKQILQDISNCQQACFL